jgi:hypothetical protein
MQLSVGHGSHWWAEGSYISRAAIVMKQVVMMKSNYEFFPKFYCMSPKSLSNTHCIVLFRSRIPFSDQDTIIQHIGIGCASASRIL